ncbi:MAG: Rrf2 family transcriptional regulator, partial [Planctomycetia bacterium]|nr:Rrf2 family transcriptional regulator [Planctomycetia bacterium]
MVSQTAEYALRAIIYLAYERDTPCTITEISFAIDAPSSCLSKVMKGLSRAGIVKSKRGLRGGFTLIRDPGELTILEVVNAVDAFQRIERCPLGKPAHTSGLCPLHRRMDNVMAAAERTLDATTFGDILEEPGLLCSLPCVVEPIRTPSCCPIKSQSSSLGQIVSVGRMNVMSDLYRSRHAMARSRGRKTSGFCASLAILAQLLCAATVGQCEEYLGDATTGVHLKHQQQWGDFGLDTAASATGGTGSPLRIGDKTFERGLGHHANGEIVIDLKGQFTEFRTMIGVQWQGGNKGSVTFRIAVDGNVVFESPLMSDSDPAKEVQVPLQHARELRLIATDSGDGIGCDMANWVEARLVRDPRMPFFGAISTSLAGEPAPPASASASGFS